MNIIDLLKHYDKKYTEGEPEVSDTEYDKLRETAKELHPHDPYFKTVGAPGEKVKLPYTLGSLNKVKIDTVIDWLNKTGDAYIISEKLDGASILVEYQDGRVIAAYTRGDGENGKDITDKAELFCPEINEKGYWAFRGEASLDNPAKFGYKNRRNGAAGLLNKDGTENCEHIKPYFYEIVEGEDVPDTEWTRWKVLETIFGNRYVPKWWLLTYTQDTVPEKVIDRLVGVLKEAREHNYYDVDGLVICLDESERENVAYPEKKIAFKVNLDAVKTIVKDIEWNVTRTARIVPVLLVEPVEISGATVSRVTGHNYELLTEMGAGIGAEIGIVRSGDVIPYIEEVYEKSHNLGTVNRCPSCYAETEIKGVDAVCPDKKCPEKILYGVEYWFRTLGAENITAVTIKKILETHLQRTWHGKSDKYEAIKFLYTLTELDLREVELFAKKRAAQVYEEIQGTLHTTDEKLLAAFGIPNVAKEIAVELVRHFGSLHDVLSAPYKELIEVEGIGMIVGSYIRGHQTECRRLWIELEELGLKLKERQTGALTGKVFCITGKLPMKRDAIIRMIENKGGVWKNTVTKKTDYLVTDNPNSGSSKNKKAQQYGTKIITFTELQEMVQ